jgi:plastocyanin
MTDVQTDAPTHDRHRRTIAGITATLAVVGLVLAGCSSSKKSSSVAAPAPVTPASTTAPTPAPTTTPTVPAPTIAATSPPTTPPAAPTTAVVSPSATPTTAASPAAATPVSATEKEYVITLSRTTFTPGTYIFTIKNIGMFKHDLRFNGPGLSNVGSALLLPGSTGSLTVSLAAGTYDVFCGVPTHKAKGMDLHITVA